MEGMRISVPLRASNMNGKKMRKRRELDALVASNGFKRYSAYNGGPLCVKPGTNYHDQLLSDSTDEHENYWKARTFFNHKRSSQPGVLRRRFPSILSFFTVFLMLSCLIATSATLWLFFDLQHQTNYLHGEMIKVNTGNQGIPESLQRCHTQIKELQRNQTVLVSRLADVESKLNNISSVTLLTSKELARIRNIMKSTSDSSIAKLFDEVQQFHNFIGELNNSVALLNSSEIYLRQHFREVQMNLTSLKEKLPLLEKVPTKSPNVTLEDSYQLVELNRIVTGLSNKLSNLNNSVNSEIEILRASSLNDIVLLQDINDLIKNNVSGRLSKVENELSRVNDLVKDLSNEIANRPTSKIESMAISDRGKKRIEPPVPALER